MNRGGHGAYRRELAKLKNLMERMSKLPDVLAVEAAPGITRLLQDEFERGVDPYGRAWAPLAASTLARGRRAPPLTDTRRLRNGTQAYALPGKGLRLGMGAGYGVFHQIGFRNHRGGRPVPARRIFPRASLPKSWVKILNDAARVIVARAKASAGVK
jgi:hypothetical protein